MSVGASDFIRNCANFHPTVWGNVFLQYASESMSVEDNMDQKVQRVEVKKMFISSNNNNLLEKLKFIDSVQRLGVSYHFECEIEEALAQVYNIYTMNNIIVTQDEHDLHSVSLLFRLLRQQGYYISSAVFNKFKKENGNFNEELANDVEGMLALYDAAQLRIHGEDILEEALDFTFTHLSSSLTTQLIIPSLAVHVNQCLRQPLHKSLPRIEARNYISFYQQDPTHSSILLNFAKSDFNMLQKMHKKEVGNMNKWWNKSEYVRKVPYSRDRLVEAYFWPLAMAYGPQYSTARLLSCKLVCIICLLDDTYDSYGTVEELELFTEAIYRWDISPIESLPECMKVVFEAVLEVYNEMELVTAQEKTSGFVMPRVKQAICELSRTYLVEAKWCSDRYIPSYDEYKENGALSSSCPLQITSFLGLGIFATKEVFDWISTDPNIIRNASMIGRLMDDMASHKFEQERVHVASGVECCMKQYGISEEEAYKILQNDIKKCWKDINEECLRNPHDVPKPVLDCVLNVGRVSELVYENFQDRFTNGDLLKHHIVTLLVDPIATN